MCTCPAHSSMVPSKVKLQHEETGEQQCQKKVAGSGIEARSSERVGEESVQRVKCVCVCATGWRNLNSRSRVSFEQLQKLQRGNRD